MRLALLVEDVASRRMENASELGCCRCRGRYSLRTFEGSYGVCPVCHPWWTWGHVDMESALRGGRSNRRIKRSRGGEINYQQTNGFGGVSSRTDEFCAPFTQRRRRGREDEVVEQHHERHHERRASITCPEGSTCRVYVLFHEVGYTTEQYFMPAFPPIYFSSTLQFFPPMVSHDCITSHRSRRVSSFYHCRDIIPNSFRLACGATEEHSSENTRSIPKHFFQRSKRALRVRT